MRELLPLALLGGVLGDEKSLGRGRSVADQRQVEVGLVVRMVEGPQIGRRETAINEVDRGLAAGGTDDDKADNVHGQACIRGRTPLEPRDVHVHSVS